MFTHRQQTSNDDYRNFPYKECLSSSLLTKKTQNFLSLSNILQKLEKFNREEILCPLLDIVISLLEGHRSLQKRILEKCREQNLSKRRKQLEYTVRSKSIGKIRRTVGGSSSSWHIEKQSIQTSDTSLNLLGSKHRRRKCYVKHDASPQLYLYRYVDIIEMLHQYQMLR